MTETQEVGVSGTVGTSEIKTKYDYPKREVTVLKPTGQDLVEKEIR